MKARRPIGRPRAFDPNRALDQALQVFWRKGYEGASLADLTKAMGINRPSMYAAFGAKEALFCKALDRYMDGPVKFMREALNEPTARRVVERMLRGTCNVLGDPRNPAGCLAVQGALACSDEARRIRGELVSRRRQGEVALRARLRRAKAEGDLPRSSSPADLARYTMTVIHGMAVQGAGGASRGELLRLVKTALRVFPQ